MTFIFGMLFIAAIASVIAPLIFLVIAFIVVFVWDQVSYEEFSYTPATRDFVGVHQNVISPSLQEIDQRSWIKQRNEIKTLALTFKPTQYSDYEKRYMPKG